MSSRPKHVSSLSDKVSGLKFMQRKKPEIEQRHSQRGGEGSSSSSHDNSGTTSLTVTAKPINFIESGDDDDDGNDSNDGNWVLPQSSRVAGSVKRRRTEQSGVTVEPGWNAWLSSLQDGGSSNKGDGGGGGGNGDEAVPITTRRVFGEWSKGRQKKAKRKSQTGQEERATDSDSGSSSINSGAEEKAEEKASGQQYHAPPAKGFIKPGTLTDHRSSHARDDRKRKKSGSDVSAESTAYRRSSGKHAGKINKKQR